MILLLLGAAGLIGFACLAAAGVAAWVFLRDPGRAADDAPAAAQTVPAPATPSPVGPIPAIPTQLTPEEINRRLLRSTVFVIRAEPGGRSVGLGSGALLHGPKRLVVTNYHVVETAPRVAVFFPDYEKGELVTTPKHYLDHAERLLVRAKVVARDAGKDLAALELERLPDGVTALPLSDRPAATGSAVYSVGASGARLGEEGGAFWRLSVGTVRGRHRDEYRVQSGQAIAAMILETQKPVNPGDSGGPTVNDRGELVGVVAAFDKRQNLVMNDIDLTEVREFFGKVTKDGGWTWSDLDAAPPSGLAPRPADPDRPPAAAPSPPPDPKADLLSRVGSEDPAVRVEAFRQLGDQKIAARWAVPALVGALDDPDDRARRMAALALDQIGLPAPEDVGCLSTALTGGKRFARLHALRHFAGTEKAAREQVPAVVAALDAPDPDTREAAARVLGYAGSAARPAALPKLLAHAADPDPGVARTVVRVLTALGPYQGADRQPLATALAGPDPALRYLAVRLLAPADAAAAIDLYRPRLSDTAAPLREQAARGLGKLGPAAKATAPDLIPLVDDPDRRVRAAAVWAVGEVGGGPGAVPALGRQLAADDPPLRDAAARTLVRIGVTDAADLPVLKTLAGFDDPGVRAAALENAARLGPAAQGMVAEAAAALGAADPRVRTAALRALAACRSAAAPHAQRVFDLLAAPPAPQPEPRPVAPPAGESVAERLTRSAAWIVVEEFGRVAGSGSGTLVDGPNRLVLTSYHVVEGGDSLVVYFPVRADGLLATRPADYLGRTAALARTRHAATGRVVASDPGLDLALVRLDAPPPDEALPLLLAQEPARPGQALHVVGAAGANPARGEGALWRYSAGKVRAVTDHRVVLDGVQPVAGRMVEADLPATPWDDGCAVATDAAELVGVHFTTDPRNRAVGYAVDLEAARQMIARAGAATEGGGNAAPQAAAPDGDQIREAAAAALAAMGPGTTDLLIRGLSTAPPPAAATRLVAALGDRGATLPRAGVLTLFDAAEKTPATRAAAADALVKIGGDEVSLLLRERTVWSSKGTGATRVKVGKYPPEVALWAVQTLGRMDPAKLTDRGREGLLATLEGLAERDLDPEGRREAQAALTRLTAAGIRGPVRRP
ncbi:MAG TPA: HEAT repeat domain-containing protein [Urbifossiella sp.]|jgi:S1-C subfamily serine protease|nr:HEAT repeat domain-containing protein [Urbifossiella sp.]